MKVQTMRTAMLKPYEKNAKNHPTEQVERIAKSIEEFGWQQPLVVDKNKVVVIGHGRLMAAKKLGLKEVPVVMADTLNEEQIRALRLADNKTAESSWDDGLLRLSLDEITDINMEDFGFNLNFDDDDDDDGLDDVNFRDPSCQHNVFENQERMQFPTESFYGMPIMEPTQTVGDQMLRFMDWKEVSDPENYIAHFYYDDYKFISAWREPDKYIERLKKFKAVVSPDFSLYTDFPRALQILSCYRRQWCGAFWQSQGIDVIPDVVWGDEKSFEYCFDGIPKGGTVAVSTVGVKNDKQWNDKESDMFRAGYNEMLKKLEPTTILFYGSMIEGCEGNIIRIPSYYEQKFSGKDK